MFFESTDEFRIIDNTQRADWGATAGALSSAQSLVDLGCMPARPVDEF